ncbi:MAG TPA: tetratricopeptide repeat protein [Nitrospira sp.]|nr:tetratricopeptide repeat protein [Nitrospira sp.]
MRLFLVVGFLVLTSASIAAAISGEEPYEALQRGDFKLAAGLFYPLAERGDARAQYNLGLLYASGLGVTQDYHAALKWHRMAAKQGHAGAQNELAQMYTKGQGVPQDYVRAHMWYSIAGESLGGGSKQELTKDREKVTSRMTPAQIEKAQEMAQRCFESKFNKCDEK